MLPNHGISFFFNFMAILRHMEFLGQGLNPSHGCDHACDHAASVATPYPLTPWAGLEIKPAPP